MINVTIWNEGRHERESESVAKVYPKGIHGCIADFLGGIHRLCEDGFELTF